MDLQVPHHENEIAQSEGAGGEFVRTWMHNGFLNIDDTKMSKSLGNFFTIRAALERFGAELVRFTQLQYHYRSNADFSIAAIANNATRLAGVYEHLLKLDELRVVVDVPQSSAIDVPLGAVVPLSFREFPGETFKATLRRRSGAIDAATGTMRIELALPNSELRLPAGLRGEAVLDVNTLGGVRVPSGALLSRDGKPHAAIVDAQGRLRFVAVQLDRTSDREVVIRGGRDAGAKVVMPLSSLLREGVQVTIAP
jgi:multidrug efflux pump subunit AcrA (membrane-fusion protein)